MTGALRSGLVLVTAGALVLAAWSGPASATHTETRLNCPEKEGECTVEVVLVEHAGQLSPGGGGTNRPVSSAPPAECSYAALAGNRIVVPCRDPELGWWSRLKECYYTRFAATPDDPFWAGNYPNGAVYDYVCPGLGVGGTGGRTWLGVPPDGFGGPGVTAAQLAVRAVELLPIRGPEIGTVPEPGPDRLGLVGLPTWMWTARLPETVGPVSRTASVPGLSVTATAQMQKIVWEMGNGDRVTCTSPGTVYADRFQDRMSPDCGYRYVEPGEYRVTATTTWLVSWAGGGQTGAVTQTRSSSTDLRVGELQVLVQ